MNKVAVVTGANQGIGFALVERLCQVLGSDASVYLTARNVTRGEDAFKKMRDKGLAPIFHQLDITDDESTSKMVEKIREEHGGIDIFISNAAARITPDIPQSEQVEHFIETNNHGTYRMIKAFVPLLKENGRFLVVASSFGSLQQISPSLHGRFDVTKRSLEEIEEEMDEYVRLVKVGRAKEHEWPEWINIPSKIAQVASTKIIARDLAKTAREKGIMICAVCPGLVDTAASRPWFEDMSGAQSPAESVIDLVWLATLSSWREDFYGELIQRREIIPWE